MDAIFEDMEGCIWWFEDILICGGNTEAKDQPIVQKIQHQCVEHGPAVNLLTSVFHIYESIFLVRVINSKEINMANSKLERISNWHAPTNKNKVQAFLSFANY